MQLSERELHGLIGYCRVLHGVAWNCKGMLPISPFYLPTSAAIFFASLRLQGERNQRQGYAGDDVSRA